MYFVCSDLLPPSWRPKQDMVWDRGIQYFIFAALMCLVTFAVIRVGVTTDPFTSNIIKGVTPLDGGVTNCYWVRTLTMTPSRIFSWVFKKNVFLLFLPGTKQREAKFARQTWMCSCSSKKYSCAGRTSVSIFLSGTHRHVQAPATSFLR